MRLSPGYSECDCGWYGPSLQFVKVNIKWSDGTRSSLKRCRTCATNIINHDGVAAQVLTNDANAEDYVVTLVKDSEGNHLY